MIEKYNATSLLVTSKDEVKLLESGFNLSVMRLRLVIAEDIMERIKSYVRDFKSNADEKKTRGQIL